MKIYILLIIFGLINAEILPKRFNLPKNKRFDPVAYQNKFGQFRQLFNSQIPPYRKLQDNVEQKTSITLDDLTDENMDKLMMIFQKEDPKTFKKMRKMKKEDRKLMVVRNQDRYLGVLGTVGVSLASYAVGIFLSRIVQTREMLRLSLQVNDKKLEVLSSRTQHRNEIEELQKSMLRLGNKVNQLRSDKDNLVTSLSDAIDLAMNKD